MATDNAIAYIPIAEARGFTLLFGKKWDEKTGKALELFADEIKHRISLSSKDIEAMRSKSIINLDLP